MDVIRDQQHPPGYPLAVWLTAKVVRHTAELSLPSSTLLATQLVSAAAAVLLVFPNYLLGRMLFGRNVGFAAALLFQLLPVPARITSDGLSEGLYLLAVGTALFFGVRAVRRPGIGGFLLCGLATGAAYLIRPEGLIVAAAVGGVAAWLGLSRVWPRDLTMGRLTALAVGLLFIAGPYMLMIGKVTNKPTGNQFLNPREKQLNGSTNNAPISAAQGPLLATWWNVPGDAGPVRVVWPALAAVVKETSKGLHYLTAGLALFGILALRRNIMSDPGLGVLLAIVGINLAVLVGLGVSGYYVNEKRTFYISERHTVLITLVGCLFAASAMAHAPRLSGRWGRLVPAGLLLTVLAVALPSTLKPMHSHREGYRHAGEWLARHAEPGACVVDPFEWSLWYAEKSLYFIPRDPKPGEAIYTYAILDNVKNRPEDHVRLPRMKEAVGVVADGRTEVAYRWPEGRPEDAKVIVYRLHRPNGD